MRSENGELLSVVCGVVIAAILLTVGPSACFAKEPVYHECGNGPHTVKVRVETECKCHIPAPKLRKDDTYIQQPEVCEPAPCYKWIDEEWSDWPECDGAERKSSSVFTIMNYDGSTYGIIE